jgi:hypothetical protein
MGQPGSLRQEVSCLTEDVTTKVTSFAPEGGRLQAKNEFAVSLR